MNDDKLFLLIHSLTKAEKLHLKKNHLSSRTVNNSNHTLLFTLMDKMKEYDEKKLTDKLKIKIKLKFLPQLKKHLHNVILKSLIEYNQNLSIDNQLNSLLMEADILSRKLLYQDLYKVLHKAEVLATTHEKYGYLVQVLDLKKKIFFTTADEKLSPDEWLLLFEKEKEIAEKINITQQYDHILYDCFWALNAGLTIDKVAATKKIELLSNSSYLKNISLATTIESRYAFYQSNMLLALSKEDHLWYYECVNNLISLIEKNKTLLFDKPYGYLDILVNQANAAPMLKQYDVFFETIRKIRSLPRLIPQANIPLVNMRVFCYANGMEFVYLCKNGSFKKALEQLPQLIKGLETYKTQIDPVNKKIFRYVIGLVYFSNGKYKEALPWQNVLINEQNTTHLRYDIDVITRLLNILVHCELNNWELVPGLIKGYKKTILATGNKYELVLILLKHLELLIPDRENLYNKKDFYSRLKDDLVPILKDPAEKRMLNTFHVIWWIESKLKNISMEEASSILLKELS
jgi:hypothetical protein